MSGIDHANGLPPYQRAEQLLSEIFTNRSQEAIQQLLELFRHHPQLTYQGQWVGNEWKTPLPTLVISGAATKEDIQELCRICPCPSSLLLTRDTYGDLPIHYACGLSSEEMIRTLIELEPKSLRKRTRPRQGSGVFPLNDALANEAHMHSFELLRVMLDACPEAVGIDSSISRAIGKECPLDFLEFMVQMFPASQKILFIRHALSAEQLPVVARLFPRLKSARFADFDNDPEGFEFFIREVGKSDMVEDVRVGLPAIKEGSSKGGTVMKALQEMLGTTSALKSIELSIPQGEVANISHWIRVVQKGFTSGKVSKLISVRIVRFSWTTGRREVLFYACKHKHPRKGRGKPSPWWSDVSVQRMKHSQQPSQGRKQYFFTQELNYAPTDSHDLIPPEVIHFSGLTSLKMNVTACNPRPSKEQFADRIVSLLRGNHSFETLKIEGQQVDVLCVLEELQSNTHLKSIYIGEWVGDPQLVATECLALIKEHNTTLRDLFLRGMPPDQRIQYFLCLNRFGRARARSSGDCPQLIEPLLQASKWATPWEEHKQSILYGLLREAPGTWCNGESRQ